jgi:hypothetical protein
MLHDASTHTPRRELAHRSADGVDVTLLWWPVDDSVSVRVLDRDSGRNYEIPARRDQAMNAFHHPFVYSALEQLHARHAGLPAAA